MDHPVDRALHVQLPPSALTEVGQEDYLDRLEELQLLSVIVQPHLSMLPKGTPSLDVAAAKRATTALKKDLAGLGLLDRARSVSVFSGFVLEVTPRQLRLLARAPGVQLIRPNFHRYKLL